MRKAEVAFANSSSYFMGSHPMAGSEKSGMKYATDKLFDNKTCVITPTSTNKEKIHKSVGKILAINAYGCYHSFTTRA